MKYRDFVPGMMRITFSELALLLSTESGKLRGHPKGDLKFWWFVFNIRTNVIKLRWTWAPHHDEVADREDEEYFFPASGGREESVGRSNCASRSSRGAGAR